MVPAASINRFVSLFRDRALGHAVNHLWKDGPPLDPLQRLERERKYVAALRADQPLADLYAVQLQPVRPVIVLSNHEEVDLRKIWLGMREVLFARPSEVFRVAAGHPSVDWLAALTTGGSLLEGLAEGESDPGRMHRLYRQAVRFFGAAALEVQSKVSQGVFNPQTLNPAIREKLKQLGKYAPWLQEHGFAARTDGELEEFTQTERLRRERQTFAISEAMRKFLPDSNGME